MSWALSAAKELVKLSLGGEEPDPLTNLRLQKLLYYAQAWSLVIRETQLFSDDIQAWRWGPVVPAVYHRLPDGQRNGCINPDAFASAPDLQGDEAEFVRCIWDAYNQYSAGQLSRMTHDEQPWLKAWGNRPAEGNGNDPISIDDMEEFFGSRQPPAPLEAYRHELRKKEEEAERKLAELPQLDVRRLHAGATSFTTRAANRLTNRG